MIEIDIKRIADALESIESHLTSSATAPAVPKEEKGPKKLEDISTKQQEVAAKKTPAKKKPATKAPAKKKEEELPAEPEETAEEITVESVAQQVRNCYAAAGDDKAAKKKAYAALREEFGIEKLGELDGDDRLPEFSARVAKL